MTEDQPRIDPAVADRRSATAGSTGDLWDALRLVLGEPLHPGGAEATDTLLDRAAVTENTRVLDVGCGAAGALELARERGADAVGVDTRPDPGSEGVVRGDLTGLPVGDGSVDVVLAECALCLSSDIDRSLAEARRVLTPEGRLAVSDVVVEGSPPALPEPFAEALCLTGRRERNDVVDRIERAGFEVDGVHHHREDLLAMRDRAADRVDYAGLLGALGDRGRELLDGIERLEAAIESGRVGYVSLVADRR